MKRRIRIALAALFIISIFSFIVPLCAHSFGLRGFEGSMASPPEPRLTYPAGETADLSGKDYLEFKWWDDFGLIDHYEFRLFKGYDMPASGLIYKTTLPRWESSLKIKSDLFEDGQVYTWSLVVVAVNEQKSDKSFNSFKVIKK